MPAILGPLTEDLLLYIFSFADSHTIRALHTTSRELRRCVAGAFTSLHLPDADSMEHVEVMDLFAQRLGLLVSASEYYQSEHLKVDQALQHFTACCQLWRSVQSLMLPTITNERLEKALALLDAAVR